MPVANVLVTQYIVRHPKGNGPCPRHCVHFITFGLSYGSAEVHGCPLILELDLSKHQPPQKHLCEEFTGRNREVAENFFSVPANEEEFHRALGELEQRMKREPQGGCVAVLINCTAGMHRSVAMAERLAEAVWSWGGFGAECLHLDLWKGMTIQEKTVAKVGDTGTSEGRPARGHRRSRHGVQATSETRASEKRPRGPAATADAVLPPREAPVPQKTVSWPTARSAGELHLQKRQTADRSADTWGKDENRGRRLTP